MAEIEFQPGDAIVPMSGAFVKLLAPEYKGKFCDNCFRPGVLHRCAGCQLMHYCGKKCQKIDWKEAHSVECKSDAYKREAGVSDEPATVSGTPEVAYWARVILRFLAKFHLHPASFSEDYPVYDGTQRSVYDMMCHEKTFFDHHPENLSFVGKLYGILKYMDSTFCAVDFDEDFVKWVVGVWWTNMFEITDERMEGSSLLTIGGGLFIVHSALDHSCRPNAVLGASESRPGEKEIRCIYPIRKGEKAVISYLIGKMNLTLDQRKSELQERFHFICSCELCTAEEKSGPLIDYRFVSLMSQRKPSFGSPHQVIIGFRERWVELLRKLYHEYDSRITHVYADMFDDLIFSKPKYKSILRKEAIDLEPRLKISLGKDSVGYLKFQLILKQLDINIA